MDQTGTYVNIMRESLERKQRYLTEIWKLTNEQSVIARAEKFDEEQFSELVEKKDVLIDNLNEIDKGFLLSMIVYGLRSSGIRWFTEMNCLQYRI